MANDSEDKNSIIAELKVIPVESKLVVGLLAATATILLGGVSVVDHLAKDQDIKLRNTLANLSPDQRKLLQTYVETRRELFASLSTNDYALAASWIAQHSSDEIEAKLKEVLQSPDLTFTNAGDRAFTYTDLVNESRTTNAAGKAK